MAKINKATPSIRNYEGTKVPHTNAEQQLRRSVMSCLLWEDEFYESGINISDRIISLIPKVSPEFAAACAYSARTEMKLRHVPLLIVREMARITSHKHVVRKLLADVIQRADEITEFLAIYWKDGKQPLSKQVKLGLSDAFNKFKEYDFAKYNRDGAVKLRDAFFLCHAKPNDIDRIFTKKERANKKLNKTISDKENLFKAITDNTLQTPDTWEVALSGGENKKEVFERLMKENKLGALAWLKNMRGMLEAGVDENYIRNYASTVKVDRILPFRFISAARYTPQWEPYIEAAMLRCLEEQEKLPGKTVLLVDNSGSMGHPLSSKSNMTRSDAGIGLAILLEQICEKVDIFSFGKDTCYVPPRKGFALGDAIKNAPTGKSTYLGAAIRSVAGKYDRLIVITDEESQDPIPNPDKKTNSYMINIASYRNGVGYGAWTHIDGWSEAVINYIRELENEQ